VGNAEQKMPFLVVLYQQYLANQDSAGFGNKVSETYTPGTLQRLLHHSSREVRRGVVLALGFVADYDANQTLGRSLHDNDRTVRMLAENAIRRVWTRAGSEDERQQLKIVSRLNDAQQFNEAVRIACCLIEKAPWFAEVWNQRAIAHFSLGQYTEAIRDCHQTLEINPYHFGAASGMGQAYLQLNNPTSGLECFRRALKLNPNLEGVRAQIKRLSHMLEGK